ncbi:MAG: helix-turn-helix transcriptional regulator [Eggerthellaceae bacterium]|nr:helix-turn-helix transcriptional regulator [Eggerthellaceae bacterium]
MKHNDTGKLIRHVIAYNIRSLRIESGQSQAKFSEMVGINRSYMNQIEHGTKNMSIDKLMRIADGLDVPITRLFAGLEDCAPHKLPADSIYALVKLPEIEE